MYSYIEHERMTAYINIYMFEPNFRGLQAHFYACQGEIIATCLVQYTYVLTNDKCSRGDLFQIS